MTDVLTEVCCSDLGGLRVWFMYFYAVVLISSSYFSVCRFLLLRGGLPFTVLRGCLRGLMGVWVLLWLLMWEDCCFLWLAEDGEMVITRCVLFFCIRIII